MPQLPLSPNVQPLRGRLVGSGGRWRSHTLMLAPEMASGEVHRTQLAHERTYLAWWRTGLAGIAAGFGVGRVLPEVVSGTNWPYIALGTALAGAGLAAMVYGIVHYRELQAALREEREPHTGEGFLLALAAVGIAVGAVSVLLVLLSPCCSEIRTHVYARRVQLAGIPIPDKEVFELARLLRDGGFATSPRSSSTARPWRRRCSR